MESAPGSRCRHCFAGTSLQRSMAHNGVAFRLFRAFAAGKRHWGNATLPLEFQSQLTSNLFNFDLLSTRVKTLFRYQVEITTQNISVYFMEQHLYLG